MRLVTDKLSSYRAAHRAVMPSVAVRTDTRTIAPKSLTSPHGNAS